MLSAKQFRKCIPSALDYKIKKDESGVIVERIAILSNCGHRITLCNNGYLSVVSPYANIVNIYTGCYTNDITDIKRNAKNYLCTA